MQSGFCNWSDVRVFLAVLRAGSTLAASKELGMAQPTVARRIDALEHELNLTLFERDTRGFRPTRDAERLAAPAAAIAAAAEAFAKEARDAGRGDARPIRLTAPSANFSASLSAILSDFTAEHPGAHFELISSHDLLDLAAGEADVAVRVVKQIDDDRLICTKLTTVTASLYASKAYADRRGLPASPSELGGHSFVVYENSGRSPRINDWLLERIETSQIVARCKQVEAMIAAVRAGFGIGPLPSSLANDDGTLVRCFEPPEGTAVSSWLVISPDAYSRPEVRAFSRFFAPRFRAIFRR